MPVPKRKRSKARRDKRFANKGLHVMVVTECKNCNSPLATHVACQKCGFYKGVKVLVTKHERTEKRIQLAQVKAQTQQGKAVATDAEVSE